MYCLIELLGSIVKDPGIVVYWGENLKKFEVDFMWFYGGDMVSCLEWTCTCLLAVTWYILYVTVVFVVLKCSFYLTEEACTSTCIKLKLYDSSDAYNIYEYFLIHMKIVVVFDVCISTMHFAVICWYWIEHTGGQTCWLGS